MGVNLLACSPFSSLAASARYFLTDANYNVAMLVTDSGWGVERIFYTAYGEPEVFPFGDVDGDYSVVDPTDKNAMIAIKDGQAPYNILADLNLDGAVTQADVNAFSAYSGAVGGRNVLTASNGSYTSGNDIGYAGYTWNDERSQWHVRHREYDPKLGRWLQRDSEIARSPIPFNERVHSRPGSVRRVSAYRDGFSHLSPAGYRDSLDLYEYVVGSPLTRLDPSGEYSINCIGCALCITAVAISCGILCGTDPMWDDPNDGFDGCMFKCILTSLGMGVGLLDQFVDWGLGGPPPNITPAGVAASACGAACLGCIPTVKKSLIKWYRKWQKKRAPVRWEVMSKEWRSELIPLTCDGCGLDDISDIPQYSCGAAVVY